MKNVLWLVLILSTSFCFSQKPVVSATKMNIVYVGVDNPISIAATNVTPEKLNVTTNEGYLITPKGNGEYILKASKTGKCIITVKSAEDVLGEYEFRAKRIPNVMASIGGKTDGKMNKIFLIAAGCLNLEFKTDFDFEVKYQVVSFAMSVEESFGVVNYISKDNKFTKDMINGINTLKPKEKISFINIKILGPDGERTIAPISFEIK